MPLNDHRVNEDELKIELCSITARQIKATQHFLRNNAP